MEKPMERVGVPHYFRRVMKHAFEIRESQFAARARLDAFASDTVTRAKKKYSHNNDNDKVKAIFLAANFLTICISYIRSARDLSSLNCNQKTAWYINKSPITVDLRSNPTVSSRDQCSKSVTRTTLY